MQFSPWLSEAKRGGLRGVRSVSHPTRLMVIDFRLSITNDYWLGQARWDPLLPLCHLIENSYQGKKRGGIICSLSADEVS